MKTPEYSAWCNMRYRCNTETNHAFARYGGRGISVCDRWNSFENFLTDLGPRPTEKHTLERRNNDGNYEPDNCCWATRKAQNRNNSGNVLLTHKGKTQCIMVWAEETGISHATISRRIQVLGWSVAEALDTAVGIRHKQKGTLHKNTHFFTQHGHTLTLA
jgi:hypothetical protein